MEATWKVRVVIGLIMFFLMIFVFNLIGLPSQIKYPVSIIIALVTAISIKDNIQRVKQV